MLSRIAPFAVLIGAIPVLIYVGMTAAFRMDMMSIGDIFGALRGWLSTGLMVGTAILAVGAILAFVGRNAGLGLAAVLLAASSGGVLYKLGEMKRVGGEVPPIHDISTDTIDPPAFVTTAAERTEKDNPSDYDGEQTASQVKSYPDIQSIVVSASVDEAFEAALAAMKTAGVVIKHSDNAVGRIEGTATTFWFGFKDDVVVRVQSGEGDVSVIDVRSKSRIGRSDLGANADRIRKIRDEILKRVDAASMG